MNCIEHVWAWMNNFIKGESPTTSDEFKRAIKLAWKNLPQETIQNFIDHVPHVMQQVINNDGELAT
jgi:hypothetical protein